MIEKSLSHFISPIIDRRSAIAIGTWQNIKSCFDAGTPYCQAIKLIIFELNKSKMDFEFWVLTETDVDWFDRKWFKIHVHTNNWIETNWVKPNAANDKNANFYFFWSIKQIKKNVKYIVVDVFFFDFMDSSIMSLLRKN